MKNLFEVLRDKENQLNELRAELKRVEEQIEKLRAAANILSEDTELASIAGQGSPAQAAQPIAASAAAAPNGSSKRWMP
jgi:chromosome segregation ATPase